MFSNSFAPVFNSDNPFLGIGDVYSSPSSCYSLRKMSKDYTGSAIRVRRSLDNSEADIGFYKNEISQDEILDHCVPSNIQALYNNATYFDGIDDRVELAGIRDDNNGTLVRKIKVSFTLKNANPVAATYIYSSTINSTTDTGFGVYISPTGRIAGIARSRTSDAPQVNSNVTITAGYHTVEVTVNYAAGTIGVKLDEGTESVKSVTFGATSYTLGTTTVEDRVGNSTSLTAPFVGVIHNLMLYRDGVNTHTYLGNGNTTANWEDQVGSIDGTLFGSPSLFTFQGYDGYVTTLYDQSGNGLDFTQSSSAAQPLIFSNGSVVTENSKPAISFNGSVGNYLECLSGRVMAISTNDLLFSSVSKATTIDPQVGDGYLMTEAAVLSPYSSSIIARGTPANLVASVWINGTFVGTAATQSQEISGFFKVGGAGTGSRNVRAAVNGSFDGSSKSVTIIAGVSNSVIGARADKTTSFFNGTIQEIVIYHHNDYDIRDIQSNQNDYWEVY